jgi:hypothetical protein
LLLWTGSVVVFCESKKLGLLASAMKNMDLGQFKGVVYWGEAGAAAPKVGIGWTASWTAVLRTMD